MINLLKGQSHKVFQKNKRLLKDIVLQHHKSFYVLVPFPVHINRPLHITILLNIHYMFHPNFIFYILDDLKFNEQFYCLNN